jgi:hypothetical protein
VNAGMIYGCARVSSGDVALTALRDIAYPIDLARPLRDGSRLRKIL